MDNTMYNIDREKIINPPKKVLLMYESVLTLIKEEGRDTHTLTVSEITAKAGIGKGTAYEYFASKEEIIAHALMYEYTGKIISLAKSVFEPEHFKDRYFRVLDWIYDNKQYNIMFSHLAKGLIENRASVLNSDSSADTCAVTENEFAKAANDYIFGAIDRFMEDGFAEGIFTETLREKRALALLSSVIQYAIVVMNPGFGSLGTISDEDAREFSYKTLVNSL